jgi:hypothetical protein
MNNPQMLELDLIKELRLRRWARQNYVPSSQRSHTWHAVVLEEMRRKDVELELDSRNRDRVTPPYVPLPPGGERRLHDRHEQQPHPRIFTAEESETYQPDFVR